MPQDFELLIIRHGHALPYSAEGDAGRLLSERGHEEARTLANACHTLGWVWSAAFISELVRAQQTASHIYKKLADDYARSYDDALPEPEPTALLSPWNTDLDALIALITKRGFSLASPCPRIALFGHNPTLSALANQLVTGDPNHTVAPLHTAEVIHLLVNAPHPIDLALAPDHPTPVTAELIRYWSQDALREVAR
jgi:phosphohistidine phosphatase SixA